MTTPNFFLVGAPKCATTTIAHCLAEHPAIYMSSPKEPMYWVTDMPGIRRLAEVPSTLDAYLSLFRDAGPQHQYIGEASALYLYSRNAVPEINAFSPNARYLAVVRNPVELAYSLHEQQVFGMFEDELDFEAAWNLQESRQQGHNIPDNCPAQQILQYRQMARLGEQIQRIKATIAAEQLCIVVYDDFVTAPRREYLRILSFLNLPDDGRTDFPRRNSAKVHRFRWLSRWVMTPPAFLQIPARILRNAAGDQGFPPLRKLKQMMTRSRVRQPLQPEFRERLILEFQDDVHLLGDLLKRNLDHWL